MTTCLGKELFIRYFPFGFEDRIWDLIVSVPDQCLSFYFTLKQCVSIGTLEANLR